VYSNGRLTLNFRWLKGTEQAEAVRDRFIALAVEKLGLERQLASRYRDEFLSLNIDDWHDRGDAVTEVLNTLVSEYRAA